MLRTRPRIGATTAPHVMAGLVPAIHAFNPGEAVKTWMPATSAGMTRSSLSDSIISVRVRCFMRVTAVLLWFGGIALAADAPPGASACSGCHPIGSGVDTPVKRLKGQDAAQIVAAVQEFRSGARAATVMDRIAKGFTDDEIRAIAAWYAAQKD